MIKKKFSLLIRGKAKKNLFKDLKGLSFYKYYIIIDKRQKEKEDKVPKTLENKVKFYYISNNNEIKSKIKIIIDNKKPGEIVLPYFKGDINSKYGVYTQNLQNNNNNQINWKIFKHKNIMNKFIGGEKKNILLKKEELKSKSYNEIKEYVGNYFIIKPINSSSSCETFKIEKEEDFNNIKSKLKTSDQYIIEEYLTGRLYSIDFIFNGENILILTWTKETPFIEFIEDQKLTSNFLKKYKENIEKYYLYFIPIRYNMNLKNISKKELIFLEQIKNKLKETGYKGLIHMEYKYDKIRDKIGFIEWGARLGWKRDVFIKNLNYFEVSNLLLNSIGEKDISKWKEKYKGIYFFKDNINDKHIIGIKTNVLKKEHIYNILIKKCNLMNISYEKYLINYFKNKGIEVENVIFTIKTKNDNLLPFYEGNNTRFDFLIYMDEENFKKWKKKRISILEDLVFHDK